jgi:hypothetical protein
LPKNNWFITEKECEVEIDETQLKEKLVLIKSNVEAIESQLGLAENPDVYGDGKVSRCELHAGYLATYNGANLQSVAINASLLQTSSLVIVSLWGLSEVISVYKGYNLFAACLLGIIVSGIAFIGVANVIKLYKDLMWQRKIRCIIERHFGVLEVSSNTDGGKTTYTARVGPEVTMHEALTDIVKCESNFIKDGKLAPGNPKTDTARFWIWGVIMLIMLGYTLIKIFVVGIHPTSEITWVSEFVHYVWSP